MAFIFIVSSIRYDIKHEMSFNHLFCGGIIVIQQCNTISDSEPFWQYIWNYWFVEELKRKYIYCLSAEIMWMYYWLSVKQDWKCLGGVNYLEDAQLPNGNLLTTRTILETMLILPWPQHYGMCIKGLKLISLILTVSTKRAHIESLWTIHKFNRCIIYANVQSY